MIMILFYVMMDYDNLRFIITLIDVFIYGKVGNEENSDKKWMNFFIIDLAHSSQV